MWVFSGLRFIVWVVVKMFVPFPGAVGFGGRMKLGIPERDHDMT